MPTHVIDIYDGLKTKRKFCNGSGADKPFFGSQTIWTLVICGVRDRLFICFYQGLEWILETILSSPVTTHENVCLEGNACCLPQRRAVAKIGVCVWGVCVCVCVRLRSFQQNSEAVSFTDTALSGRNLF